VLIARAGLASRRGAEVLIRDGLVTVNGHVVTTLGSRADPSKDRILVGGRPLRGAAAPVYIAFHKPTGMVTTRTDPEGRPCVGDVIADLRLVLHPVGRLDFHTSGLLLLTNDGELTARLTHARYGIPKTYAVKADRPPTEEELRRLRAGVRIDTGEPVRADIGVSRAQGQKARMTITIHEGRNRQIRRMLEAVGLRVDKLRRVAIGPLKLGRLPTGATRRLTRDEVRALKRATGLE
jgi:23S rRNA pseudouridine2605 synthase